MSTTEHPISQIDGASTSSPRPAKDVSQNSRLTKLKTAFLYVLIGALVASAVTAVLALLLGNEFSAAMSRSLLTIFILFAHSLFILAILWADTRNQVGRKLLPTSILALTFANMITTMLGTWDIIGNDTAWRAFWLYFLILGAVFIIVGTLKLRIKHTATQATIYTSVGLIAITTLALSPWVLDLFAPLDELYFRIVAALSIVTATAYMVAIIMRGIALGHSPELKATNPLSEPTPGGLLAIYITLGTLTSLVWCFGLTALLISGTQANNPAGYDNYQGRYNSYY
jgi:hypothetical protein